MIEKVDTMKKTNNLVEVLSTRKAKYVIGTLAFGGLGIAIPRIFHVLVGSSAGVTFLPMHLMVLIAALTFGIMSSSIVAGSSVIFSYLLTGMPTIERMPYMLIELLIYGILLGLFNKKFNSYISLIATMILGRLLYAGVLYASVNLLGFNGYGISVMQSVVSGIPGIIIQIALVPVLAMVVKKGIKLDE